MKHTVKNTAHFDIVTMKQTGKRKFSVDVPLSYEAVFTKQYDPMACVHQLDTTDRKTTLLNLVRSVICSAQPMAMAEAVDTYHSDMPSPE